MHQLLAVTADVSKPGQSLFEQEFSCLVDMLRIGIFQWQLDQALDPGEKALASGRFMVQVRKLQMGVGIDQSGDHRLFPQIEDWS
jgi:hypothetical protein